MEGYLEQSDDFNPQFPASQTGSRIPEIHKIFIGLPKD